MDKGRASAVAVRTTELARIDGERARCYLPKMPREDFERRKMRARVMVSGMMGGYMVEGRECARGTGLLREVGLAEREMEVVAGNF